MLSLSAAVNMLGSFSMSFLNSASQSCPSHGNVDHRMVHLHRMVTSKRRDGLEPNLICHFNVDNHRKLSCIHVKMLSKKVASMTYLLNSFS